MCCDRGTVPFFGQELYFCRRGQATQTKALPNNNHCIAGGMGAVSYTHLTLPTIYSV